jgi:DNA-binding SARP family transcriptional activator/tetratricopeptide (TPR) repeat protein
MAVLMLSLLGSFQAEWQSGRPLAVSSKKACGLLAYLALQPERMHSREVLADLLWPESGPEQSRASLRQAIVTLRRDCDAVSPGLIVVDGDRLGLDHTRIQVDVAKFEECLAGATEGNLKTAMALYRGPLLDGLAVSASTFESWLRTHRQRLTQLSLRTFESRIAATLESAPVLAADLANGLLALDPTNEAGHRALMHVRAAQGDRAAAIRQYQLCITTLRRELGVQPSVETRDLYQQILRAGASSAQARGSTPVPVAAAVPQTMLIGRRDELARLTSAVGGTAQGRGSLLAVISEAGIGKSRLVAELVDQTRRLGHGVLIGHCYDAEQILPYQVWTNALLPLAGSEALRRLSADKRAALVALSPTLSSSARPATSAQLLDPRPIFEAVAALLFEAAAERPLLVVLEDLHWADELSIRLLAFIGRQLRDRAIALVATVRAEELHDVPLLRQLLATAGPSFAVERLPLGHLNRSQTAALVRAVAGSRKPAAQVDELATKVWTLGQGHPFMTVEAMRAAEDGEPAFSHGMPRRIEDLIEVRLARLSAGARQAAAAAAVIGRPFDIALLREAGAMAEVETAATAEELVRRGIFDAIGSDLKFAHDRFREVLYAQMLAPIRKALHASVARALRRLEANDLAPHYSALAIHSRESEDWEATQHFFHEAGLLALAPGALRTAVECFEQALQALARLPANHARRERQIDVCLALHYALIPLGQPVDFRRHLDHIGSLIDGLGDRRLDGYMAVYRASDAYFTGALPQAIAYAEEALVIAGEADDARLRDLAHHYLKFAYHDHADFERALDVIERQLQDLRPEPRHMAIDSLVTAHAYRAGCLLNLGDFAAARAAAAEALRIAGQWDSDYFTAWALYAAGVVELNATDWPAALANLERALELARSREIGLLLPAASSALGFAQVHERRAATGIPLMEEAVSQMRVAGATMWIGTYEYRLAEGYFQVGRLGRARAALDRAVAAATARGERTIVAWATWLEGELALAASDTTTARAKLDDALTQGESLALAPLLATCRISLAQCRRMESGGGNADADGLAALQSLNRLGMPGRLREATALLEREIRKRRPPAA